jgi:hyperosmotically inducible protein
MTSHAPSLRHGIALAAALAALALTGCNKPDTPDSKQVSAGTVLDDSVITTKVKSALLTDSQAHGADTSVETRKGEVLLSGFVDNQAQADREVQLAKAVEGVQSVQNKLMIKDGKSTAGAVLDDSVVTVKVKSALMTDGQTKANQIAVTTNKGVVQLSGFVDSADEQARATSVARNVEGVQSVVNDTSIKK